MIFRRNENGNDDKYTALDMASDRDGRVNAIGAINQYWILEARRIL